eukprot:4916847-Amphidinium_carterae.1
MKLYTKQGKPLAHVKLHDKTTWGWVKVNGDMLEPIMTLEGNPHVRCPMLSQAADWKFSNVWSCDPKQYCLQSSSLEATIHPLG